ncbi:TniQ family protein [Paraburkholderia sabiae]|uniref:TniQ family protein n=1 Tax=Paraburkholderia sabiae TaxID=273251 RepID=A0ABU9QMJ9_9BURK|nr:TniQ family protein [Paraburkholderia sabiae]WJZ79141.1 TniQ family protein [Paraburkholderia sabiae]CAD6514427.1 hypothetical protein LMG24235_00917 [Paraburkholderia sabiae]
MTMQVRARVANTSARRFCGRWAGLDLSPMLHESVYSVLSRFAQRNALDFKTLRAALQVHVSGRREDSFYESSLPIERALNGLTGWNWASHEARLESVSAVLAGSVWSPVLRHCPVCLEAGLHCAWYQCELLSVCPFHGCELVTRCQTCGAPSREYGFSSALFGDAYACWSCRGPVAGAGFDMKEHLEIRSTTPLINARLHRVQRWFEAAVDRCGWLQQLAHRQSKSVMPAGYTRRLLRHAMLAVHPWMDDLTCDEHITILTWDVLTSDPVRRSPDVPSWRRDWSHHEQTQRVYRATLRVLRTAIDAEVGGVDSDLALDLAGRFVPGRFDLHSYVLAYFLLRFFFERTSRFDWRSDHVSLSREPIATGYIGDRVSRRCVRAFVLAAYAGILGFVQRARARGDLTLDSLRADIDALVCYCIDRHKGADCGFVIFPDVPWLPTEGLRAEGPAPLRSFERLLATYLEGRSRQEVFINTRNLRRHVC